jgi:RNA polymerase-binding transcription factor DksA
MQFPNDLVNEIRKNLEAEKKSSANQIDELTKQDPFSDPDRLNDNAASDTDAAEESDHDRVSAQIEELKKKISEIDEALERIENGKYGICKICNNMIDTDRLNILPSTTLCLNCEKTKANSIPKTK